MRKTFAVAVFVVIVLAVVLGLYLSHHAVLWMFRELQVSTLGLFGMGFFAGAAVVYLAGIWGHSKKDGRSVSAKTRQSVSLRRDEDL